MTPKVRTFVARLLLLSADAENASTMPKGSTGQQWVDLRDDLREFQKDISLMTPGDLY